MRRNQDDIMDIMINGGDFWDGLVNEVFTDKDRLKNSDSEPYLETYDPRLVEKYDIDLTIEISPWLVLGYGERLTVAPGEIDITSVPSDLLLHHLYNPGEAGGVNISLPHLIIYGTDDLRIKINNKEIFKNLDPAVQMEFIRWASRSTGASRCVEYLIGETPFDPRLIPQDRPYDYYNNELKKRMNKLTKYMEQFPSEDLPAGLVLKTYDIYLAKTAYILYSLTLLISWANQLCL